MKILIDNGHGRETAGKRSPDGRLREWAWARETAKSVVARLRAEGCDAHLLVPETGDVTLTERVRRVNAVCKTEGAANVVLVSIHCNAAGADGQWHAARGWGAHVYTKAGYGSKTLARGLIEAAEREGLTVRRHSREQPYWPQNLAICRETMCAAVLTENLFMDNREDVALLLSDEGREKTVRLHVEGILRYVR